MNRKENLKNIKLVAVDMDGTALNDAKELSPLTVATFKELMQQGIKVCVSSGRSWPGAEPYVRQLGADAPVISNNGAMVIDPVSGEVIRECVLVPKDALVIYRMACERDTSMTIWSNNVLYCNRIDRRTLDYGQRYGNMKPTALSQLEGYASDAEAFTAMSEKGITKLLWYDTEEHAGEWGRTLQAYPFESVNVNTSEPCFLEFFNKQISKGKTLEYVCGLLGISLAETVAIGDGENDISMLDIVGYAVVPDNARDVVKAHADEVTPSNNENGIALFLRRAFL